MPSDLPPDQSRATAELMLRIHADFRRGHGLPPLPTAWTLLRDLPALRSRALLVKRSMRDSSRPIVGFAITTIRRLIRRIVGSVVIQSELNDEVILDLEALARDREFSRHARHVLTLRIAELERRLERLSRTRP